MPVILTNDEEFKIIYPNGINEDGGLNNITFTVSSIDSINNKNILNDTEATFEAGDDAYTFETKANYHGNRDLVSQKMTFDKKSLTPAEVYVVDSEGEPRVTMKFTSFKFDEKLADGYFDCQQTMEYSYDEHSDKPPLRYARNDRK